MATTRREFLKVAGGAAAAGAVGFPAVARAQAKPGVPSGPVKIGILAIRAGIAAPTGPAYAFSGFFRPVDSRPIVNQVKAGQG